MAAQPNPAAPAAADAPKPGESGASPASTTFTPAARSPLSLPTTSAIDVEDLLDGDGVDPGTDSNQDDSNRDEGNPAADKAEGTHEEEDQQVDGSDEEHIDETLDVVEDQDGKRLVSAKHLERALKQRATAKAGEREALARAEAAEKRVADLTSQIEADFSKPAGASGELMKLLAPDTKIDPNNAEHLESLEKQAKEWQRWCRRNPHGGEPKEGEDWSVDQVAAQLEWAEDVLAAIPKQKDFQAKLATERAKLRAEKPRLFQVGTEEQKAYAAARHELLNLATAANQDLVIAKLVDYEAMKQREAAEGGQWVFVPKKAASARSEGALADKPKPKPVQVTTRPVGSVKPGPASNTRATLADRLAAGPVDPEDFLDAA